MKLCREVLYRTSSSKREFRESRYAESCCADFYPSFGRLLSSLSAIRYSTSAHTAVERLSFKKITAGSELNCVSLCTAKPRDGLKVNCA